MENCPCRCTYETWNIAISHGYVRINRGYIQFFTIKSQWKLPLDHHFSPLKNGICWAGCARFCGLWCGMSTLTLLCDAERDPMRHGYLSIEQHSKLLLIYYWESNDYLAHSYLQVWYPSYDWCLHTYSFLLPILVLSPVLDGSSCVCGLIFLWVPFWSSPIFPIFLNLHIVPWCNI